jgi:hypothetical protein
MQNEKKNLTESDLINRTWNGTTDQFVEQFDNLRVLKSIVGAFIKIKLPDSIDPTDERIIAIQEKVNKLHPRV